MMPYDENTIMWQLSFPMPEDEAINLSKKGAIVLKQEGIHRL
jgi:salicylate hydroxylase